MKVNAFDTNFNATDEERAWFKQTLWAAYGARAGEIAFGSVLLAAEMIGSSNLVDIAATPSGGALDLVPARVHMVTEAHVVLVEDPESTKGAFVATVPFPEAGRLKTVTKTISKPMVGHVTFVIGRSVFVQLPLNDEHGEAIDALGNGARIVIPRLKVNAAFPKPGGLASFRARVRRGVA